MIELQDTPLARVHRIRCGIVRCAVYAEDGQRRILRFATEGDHLGLCGIEAWRYTLEAVTDVVLDTVSASALDGAIDADAKLRHEMRVMASAALRSREAHLAALGERRIEDRLAWFLRWLARRSPAGNWFRIEMPRRDIAEHLAMTVESVSRAFTVLRSEGRIAMDGPALISLTAPPALAAA